MSNHISSQLLLFPILSLTLPQRYITHRGLPHAIFYFRVGVFLYYYIYRTEGSLFSLEIVRKSTAIPNHVFYLQSHKSVLL